MKTRNFLFIAFFSIFSFSLNAQNDTTKIVILHANDMHAKIDMLPQMAYQINKIKSENDNVFLFSAGDNFTGNPIVDQFNDPGYPMIDLMNLLGFDISCVGNHEFDYGQEKLNERINQANFPFLCANIETSNTSKLNPIDDFYRFYTKDSISIGVVGLIQREKNKLPASNPTKLIGLSFSDPIKYAKRYNSYQDSADIMIALSHVGFEGDEKLSKSSPIFDIIIGGHTHTVLPKGIMENNTMIVQSGAYAKFLGVLTFYIADNEIISISDSLIDLQKSTNEDEKIRKIVDKYNDNPIFDVVLGVAKNDIVGHDELGSLMTDAMVDTLGVDIAFQNIGGIRIKQLSKGNITKKNILELSPFGNTFVIYEMNIKQIKKLIKYVYLLENENNLQVSGLNIELIIDKNKKLKQINLADNNGNELTKKTYSVAINDYMTNAYELKFLKKPTNKSDIIDAEATMNFIKKNKIIDYSGTKRVKTTIE